MENKDPSTVAEIYIDYRGRHRGFMQAFFVDVDTLYSLCDPETANLCLYAYPNGTWEVKQPGLEIPASIPEPTLGINFARDGMLRQDWLELVAYYCESWLIAVASFFGSSLNRDERKRLFDLINELPTLSELVKRYPSS